MAVTAGHADAPGRGAVFEPDPRRTVGYRICRAIFVTIVGLWFRPKVTGRANIPADGPVILAPVHRSFADFGFSAFVTHRKLFFMAKDGLWKNRFLGWLLLTLGAFPVHRESADREALAHAEAVLRRGQLLVLFPEGMRQEGPVVGELAEGAAFLAARTGAPIVPIGIGNSDAAMPKGRRIPKPLRIRIVVGEPLPAPARTEGGRVSRSKVHATTEELRERIQATYDLARTTSTAPAARGA
ncbi:MAG TPA: lysophospholipid acyltransferase family protein [Acidimicrobiales bacterium]|nr:lysophospholipid acyltransferase family protein [Acidimicrobiales bacterium]